MPRKYGNQRLRRVIGVPGESAQSRSSVHCTLIGASSGALTGTLTGHDYGHRTARWTNTGRQDAMCQWQSQAQEQHHNNVYAQDGTLDKYGVELLGAKLPSINRAEDRNLFKEAMQRIGLKTPQSGIANNIEEALKVGTCFGAHRAAAALG